MGKNTAKNKPNGYVLFAQHIKRKLEKDARCRFQLPGLLNAATAEWQALSAEDKKWWKEAARGEPPTEMPPPLRDCFYGGAPPPPPQVYAPPPQVQKKKNGLSENMRLSIADRKNRLFIRSDYEWEKKCAKDLVELTLGLSRLDGHYVDQAAAATWLLDQVFTLVHVVPFCQDDKDTSSYVPAEIAAVTFTLAEGFASQRVWLVDPADAFDDNRDAFIDAETFREEFHAIEFEKEGIRRHGGGLYSTAMSDVIKQFRQLTNNQNGSELRLSRHNFFIYPSVATYNVVQTSFEWLRTTRDQQFGVEPFDSRDHLRLPVIDREDLRLVNCLTAALRSLYCVRKGNPDPDDHHKRMFQDSPEQLVEAAIAAGSRKLCDYHRRRRPPQCDGCALSVVYAMAGELFRHVAEVWPEVDLDADCYHPTPDIGADDGCDETRDRRAVHLEELDDDAIEAELAAGDDDYAPPPPETESSAAEVVEAMASTAPQQTVVADVQTVQVEVVEASRQPPRQSMGAAAEASAPSRQSVAHRLGLVRPSRGVHSHFGQRHVAEATRRPRTLPPDVEKMRGEGEQAAGTGADTNPTPYEPPYS